MDFTDDTDIASLNHKQKIVSHDWWKKRFNPPIKML